ncbi:hypothetical protein A2703_00915 [Candidatus Collierbacteria bacterium RIFCSPHIGHO2_01_FULL_50_25]|uniref:DUF5671 domain-containing protein n=1 Tax=Candidatus Collierbacteria bacterium RIFCSPHIGHO2_01_FULL_50_25 TaxID=1817722 RepID=A0A1F5EX14_9BACT|nr:MAG: hypothetical protein A2703_00915 [Candidatus Collierbacteria bacterium RIFCSPHIGHO2_01_FULL_50_25]
MKKIVGLVIPFLATHVLCCGALLYFLWSTGLLISIAREGRSRVYFLPIFIIGLVFFWLHRSHKKACHLEGHFRWGDRVVNFLFFLTFYLMMSLVFIVYVFIPWWIPGYDGGLILP